MDMDLIDEVVDFVFDGAIDPREVRDFVSKMDDSSEVHVPGNSKKAPKAEIAYKKKRRDVNIGLANNAFGAAAGTVATAQAYKAARKMTPETMQETRTGRMLLRAEKKITPEKMQNSRVGRALLKAKIKPARAIIPIAGTALVGTQLLNGGMDAQSAGYFAKERATMKKPKSMTVKKNIDHIINLRRLGQITTEQAIAMADEEVSKSRGICSECGSDTDGATWCEQCMEVGTNKVRKSEPSVQFGTHPKEFVPTTPRVISPDPVHNAGGIDLGWSGSISKVDTDKRQVFGWCSLTEVDGEKVVDRQGDYIPLDEVEKSAYNYVIHSRKGGDMHKRDGEQPLHTSDMIESFVVTPEKLENLGLERDALPHGWWVGFKVNDDKQWEEVKKGDKVHFSIHGKGRRVEKSL